MGPFELHRPRHVEEALELLEEHGEDCRPYAGGTELVLLMKLGLASPAHLVDLKRLGLNEIGGDDGELVVGACATHSAVENAPAVRQLFPALSAAASTIGNVRVRSVGTLGGNLAFAEPSSDLGTVLLLADAELELRSHRGSRSVPVSDFFVHSYTTVMEPDELLAGARLRASLPGEAVTYHRVAVGERPTAAVGCRIALGPEGRIRESRIAVGAAHPLPVRVPEAEAVLAGAVAAEARAGEAIDQIAELLAAACEPVSDVHASAGYKRRLISVLARRSLRQALKEVGTAA